MKSMVKHSQIILITVTLFLSSLVVCPTPQTEITYDEEPNFSALPNEFPELSSFYTKFDVVTQENFLKLKNVIGYLPFNEQIALMKSTRGASKSFFNFADYENYIKTSTDSTQPKTSYFDEQVKAIGDYVTQQERTLSYGIGCLKAISNMYASKSEYNQQMQTTIYKSIDSILRAQSIHNQCQAKFISALQAISVTKRGYLFSLQVDSNKKLIKDESIFEYDSKENVIGFKYQRGTDSILVGAFNEFALCQNIYTNILATSSIQAEIALSNMDECKDYDNPNNNAGNSSDVYDNPSIAYRKNDKQKGINNGNLVRSDQKTFNGYLLNHGFNFGKATSNNNYKLSSEYNALIENIKAVLPQNGIKEIDTIIKNNYLPYGGLINVVDMLINQANPIKQYLTNKCSTNKDYSITSDSDFTNLLKDSDFQFTQFKVYGYCVQNQPITLVVTAYNPILGHVFDMQYQDTRIGSQTTSTIQGCMASFSSGGSNDKDACRDVMKKKCGTNLDYHCKKSGFYDYINANPSSQLLPYNCTYFGIPGCANWIEKYFFAGQLVIKPSAFVGYNLYLSSTSRENYNVGVNMNYRVPLFTNDDFPSHDLSGYHTRPNMNIQILGSTEAAKTDISEKTVLMDKGAYKILHDGAKALNYGLSILLFTIALLI